MAPQIAILLIIAACCSASDFDLVKERTISDLRESSSGGSLPPSPSPDGTWPDIDYRSGCAIGRVEWPAVQHLDRVLAMAGSSMNATISALDFWFEHDYRDEGCTDTESTRCCGTLGGDALWNTNWWWNRIGVPMRIGPICLLLESQLGVDRIAHCSRILRRSDWRGSDGANLLWMVRGAVWDGLLTGNVAKIAAAYKASAAEARYASDGEDGIQPDGGFLAHNGVLYTGGYGAAFADVFVRLFSVTSGTAFEPTPERRGVFDTLALEGLRWAVSDDGTRFDPSSVGRGIARPGGINATLPDCIALSAPPPTGNRIYASSDYAIHRRPNYFVSVKASSERVAVSECVNGENMLGHRLGDGVMFVNRPGAYDDVAPLWDWNALPGITVPVSAKGDNGGCATVSDKGTGDFVGGASDGVFGVFAMRSDEIRKAWFMFEDEIAVAIVPNSDGETMRSVLDSRVLRGDVTSNAYGERAPMGIGRTRSSPWWIRHDSVTYIIPDNARGSDAPVEIVTTVPRDGRWSRISASEDTVTTKATFTAWFEHRGPSHYIVVPHTVTQDPEAIIDDVVIRHNSDSVQCIANKRLGVVGIVFWEAWTTASLPGWSVTANRPCVILAGIVDAGRNLRITIADPTHKLDRVSVRVTRESDGVSGTLVVDTSARNGASHFALWDGSDSDPDMSPSDRPRSFLLN